MPDLARADHGVHSNGRAWLECHTGMVDRRGHFANFTNEHGPGLVALFADRKGGAFDRRVRTAPPHLYFLAAVFNRRGRENIDADETRSEELSFRFHLRLVLVRVCDSHVRGREAMRMHLAIVVPWIVRFD